MSSHDHAEIFMETMPSFTVTNTSSETQAQHAVNGFMNLRKQENK